MRRPIWYVVLSILFFGCGVQPKLDVAQTLTPELEVEGIPPVIESEFRSNPNSPLGINLREIVDYSDEDPFLDYIKTSRVWFGQTDTEFDTQESDQIDLDENGWVRSLLPLTPSARFTRVATIMMVSGEVHNNYAGEYVVLYEGKGQLGYGGASILESAPGRDLISVTDPAGYLQVQILKTDPQDYLRNIHVVKKQYEQEFADGAIFNPVWLEKLQPFRTIRFMDWMRTNGSQQSDFSLRTQPQTARYTTELGAPLEVMIALSNQLHAEPWFNMPAPANDDFIRLFAQTVRASLDPSLRVYVEYSNEVWNTGAPFHPQGSYIDQQAAAEFGDGALQDFFTARLNWHGKRTAEMCRIWKSVFSGEENRVICVLGAQAANTYTAEQALDCPLWVADKDNPNQDQRRCQEYGIYAVAIAPYFGSYIGDFTWQEQTQTWNIDQLFEEIINGGLIQDPVPGDFNDPHPQGALVEARSFMREYHDHAVQYGYHLLAYEGGQHLAGIGSAQNNQNLTALFSEANRDARMNEIYLQYLKDWQMEAFGETFVLYYFAGRYSQFGNWGLMEYIEQENSPKYRAVTEFVQSTNCWWDDCRVK